MIDAPTKALRLESPSLLRLGLVRMLLESEAAWTGDVGGLPSAMAPYYDCARRLGQDPASFFAEVAAVSPPAIADHVRDYGMRTDIEPQAVEETPDGPRYLDRR